MAGQACTPTCRSREACRSRATAILRAIAAKVAAHPAFELAWPLMCIVLLLRFQLGPDVFTWRSLTWSSREPLTVAVPDL